MMPLTDNELYIDNARPISNEVISVKYRNEIFHTSGIM